MAKHLPDRADIEKILKEVKDPETGLTVLELGLVKAVDYIQNEKKVVVRMDFKRRTPSCPACASIAWVVQKKIVDEIAERLLSFEGIEKVEVKEGS